MTLLLSNEEIDGILTMEMALDCVERSQRSLEAREAVNSPRVDTLAPTTVGETKGVYSLKAMSGLWPDEGMAALRINSDVLVWPEVMGNVRRDRLASADGRWNGLMLLFSMETGAPVMICPDGYISRMRVGAANGLAARYLAREDASVMALLGTGWQAGGQLMAHCAVRPITDVKVFSTNPANRERFCRELAPRVQARLTPVETADEAVEGADLVVTGTNSMEPVHQRKWLRPGVHFSAVKVQEMDYDFLDAMDRVFLFSRNPANIRPAGLPHARGGNARGHRGLVGRARHAAVGADPGAAPGHHRRRAGTADSGRDHGLCQQRRSGPSVRGRGATGLPRSCHQGCRPDPAHGMVHPGRASVASLSE